MPTIEGKKNPENVQFVTADVWKIMKDKGLDRRYNLVDDNDIQQTVIPTPESIVNFPESVEIPKQNIEPILSREEIKAQLDEKEIEYNTRASTEKLLELLNK